MKAPPSGRRPRETDVAREVLWVVAPVLAVFGVVRLLLMAGFAAPPALFDFAILLATWFGGWHAGLASLVLSFFIVRQWVEPRLIELATGSAGGAPLAFLVSAVAVYAAMLLARGAKARAEWNLRQVAELRLELERGRRELEQSATHGQRLQEVTAALVRALTPPQVVRAILDEGVPRAGAKVGLLVLAEESGVQVTGTRGLSPALLEAVRRRGLEAFGGAQGASGAPRWIEGGPLLPGFAEEAVGTGSWAVLPVRVGERWLGTLALGFEGDGRFDEEERQFMQLLVEECAKALDRSRLYAAERSARVMAQFAERQVGFLAAASARLAATLEPTQSLAEVADLTVANLGDFCAIHLRDDHGASLVAGSLVTNEGVVRFGGDEDRYPVHPEADVGYPAVMRTGRGELLPVIDDAIRERTGRTPSRIAGLAKLGLTTQVCVPLRARSEILGAITVGSLQTGRRFTYAELVLAEELASRVAQALDNAMLYQNALQASRAKSSFLAVMSHELRTPLNAILGYSDLILLGVPAEIGPQTRHQVERIRRAAHNLLQIVDDVLNFARVESGKDHVRIGVIGLTQLVSEAVELIRPLAAEKGLALTCDAEADVVLHTDAGKVGQILNNLLSNAVKFTETGAVDVSARRDVDTAVITVRDTGIGVPAEHLEHIFDPFWQVEQTPTRRYGGTGIGLGVARNLARLLGGDVIVRPNEDGPGSTFTLRLPLRYETLVPRAEV